MKAFRLFIVAGLAIAFTGATAQNAETSDKTQTATKPVSPTTVIKKETKSETTSATVKSGSYQKVEKQSATTTGSKSTRKPKTKKERLEMEAASGTQASQGGVLANFTPGPDGYIEVGRDDIQSFVSKMGDGRLKVKSFTLVYLQNGSAKKIVNNSNEIGDEVRDALKGFGVGQTFSIEDVKGVTRNGREITLPVYKFRIKNVDRLPVSGAGSTKK